MNKGMILRTHCSTNEVDKELRRVIEFLANVAKYISFNVKMPDLGESEKINMFGERQLQTDLEADKLILENLQPVPSTKHRYVYSLHVI